MAHVLATGRLTSRGCVQPERVLKYSICFLDEKHLPAVMELQALIVQNLKRPDLLQPFSCDFMKQHMGSRGIVLGVFAEGRLIAFRNVYFPDDRDREWNLGIDLGLPAEELSNVANLQMVCVHPDCRGNSLALKMNTLSLGLLRERGLHHHICATVSPYNVWNIRILLNSGFRIARLTEKYGGKLRYVVHQNLRNPIHFSQGDAAHIPLDDLCAQKTLLRSGLSGVGIRCTEAPSENVARGGYNLIFKSPIAGKGVPGAAPMAGQPQEDGQGMGASPYRPVNSFSASNTA